MEIEIMPICTHCNFYALTYTSEECYKCQGGGAYRNKVCDECGLTHRETVYIVILGEEHKVCKECFQTVFKGDSNIILRIIS